MTQQNIACLLTVYFFFSYSLNTACPAGYYGLKCRSECVGICKDKEPCNHTNGLCDKGCDDGWTGANCREGC